MSHTVVLTPDTSGGTLTAQVDGVAVGVAFNGRRRSAARLEGGDRHPDHSGSWRRCRVRSFVVLVKPGDAVRARQPIVVIEAMKMENELRPTVTAGSPSWPSATASRSRRAYCSP